MSKGSILVVDDTPGSLKQITDILAAEGYKALPADSGELALSSVAANPPELILLDTLMPGMDGFEVMRRLKAREESRGIPVILLSAVAETAQRVEGFKLGAVDFIPKPFDRSELLARVRAHLELFRLRGQLHAAKITDLKEAEEALRESKLRFRSTFEQAAVGIAHVAPDGHWLDVNQKLCDIVGYTREELHGRTFQSITHPNDLGRDLSYVRQLVAGEIPHFTMEKRYIHKSGKAVWVDLTVSLVRRPDGAPDYFIGVVEDISERKLAEEKLRQSEERYRALTEQADEGIFVVDQKGHYLEVNSAGQKMVGYSLEELRSMTIVDLMPPDDREKNPPKMAEIISGKTVINERTLRRKDGSFFLAEITAKLITDGNILATKRNITERKRREEESSAHIHYLTSLNRIYRAFDPALDVETALPVALKEILSIFDCDRAWLLYPLDKAAKTYKIPFEVTKPEYPGAFTSNKELPVTKEVAEIFRLALDASEPVSMNLVEGITDEAQLKEFDIKTQLVVPIYPKTGKPWKLGMHQCSRVREWTKEEKELFQAISLVVSDKLSSLLLVRNLSESEERHRILFNNASVGIGISGEGGQIVAANKTLLNTLGYSMQEFMEMRLAELFVLKNVTGPLFEQLSRDGEVHDFETKLRKKEGSEFDASLTLTKYNLGGQPVIQAMILDVTERKRAEGEKQEALNRLQKIARRVPGVVYQFRLRPDGSFCFPYASDALRDICRVDPEDVREDASKAFAAVHPDDFPPLMASVMVSAQDLTPWRQEFRLKFDDGVERHLLGNASPEREAGGGTLWHGVITDITERKQAEEALRESSEILERIFATTHVNLVLLDAKFNFIRVNKAYADVCGFPPDYFLGKNHFGLYPSEELKSRFQRVVQTGEPYTVYSRPFEWPDRPHLGVTYWDLAVYPVKGVAGEVEGLLFTLLEVTKRVKAEKALIAAKEEAERANKAKSVFLSSMSHEIRTPLTSVIGFSQLLASDTANPLNEFQKQLLEKVVDSGNHLLELITSVLDLAKIESGRIEKSIESLDMKSFAEIELISIVYMAERHGIRYKLKTPAADCYVMADRGLLRKALTNLLSNAIKYNKKGGETVLSWDLTAGNRVRISVSDEGAGIPVDNVDKLFEPFDRLGMEGRNIQGFGIGLTIVKRLAESMGGQVGVLSELGKGSTFYIELPAGKKPGATTGQTSQSSDDPAALSGGMAGTVLYVDDIEDNRELVKLILEDCPKIELIACERAEEGIKIAHARKPDVILMDIELPGMNGYEALKRLKSDDKTRGIPVVAISVRAMKHEIKAGKAAGFDDYITKPFAKSGFFEALGKFLNKG